MLTDIIYRDHDTLYAEIYHVDDDFKILTLKDYVIRQTPW